MKTRTTEFKTNIKELGRELDTLLTYTYENETTEIDNEDLFMVSPHYDGSLLKSVMKQLDIDCSIELPIGAVVSLQVGVKVRNEEVEDYRDNYDYVSFGNYVVKELEKKEDTGTYLIKCYDKILYSMKDYVSIGVSYPITIRNYINALATYLGLTFKNASDTFANYDKQITKELYLDSSGNSLGYTFRDVLDELAQATGSTICINEEDDELEIRYVNSTGDTIDEEYLKDTNVNFSEQYGPVNTIILSRSADSDKVYRSYPENLPDDEKISIVIKDNQIMNGNDRADYLPDILSRLLGLQYYINDFSSIGILYYNVCDKYNIQIGDNTYDCLMLNDDITIKNGLSENIFTNKLETAETDYTKADKTDRKINQTYLIVDKQNQTIESVVSQTIDTSNPDSTTNKVSRLTQKVDELQSEISNVTGMVQTKDSTLGTITFTDPTTASQPITIKVYPINDNISYLYPNSALYPSSTTYLKIRTIRFHNNTTNEDIDYVIPDDLLYYDGEHYDEFYLDLNSSACQITKKCKFNVDGTIGLLDSERIDSYDFPTIELTEGTYTVSLLSYNSGYLLTSLVAKNIYTDQFYTKVETDSKITQKADEIELGVSETLSNYSTTAQMNSAINVKANEINSVVSTKVGNNEVISKINQTAESITINANKLNLTGYITTSDLSGSGTTTINGSNITTGTINANLITTGTLSADRVSGGTLSGSTIIANTGSIGRFNITETYLETGSGSTNAGIGGNAAFWAGSESSMSAPFHVTYGGVLTATGADISGKVSASSGNIGNWKIQNSNLYAKASNNYEVQFTPQYLEARAPGDTWEYLRWYDLVFDFSDKKTKSNIKELDDKYDKLYDKLRPISFKYKDDYEPRINQKNRTHIGFIAQDIEEAEKETNTEDLCMVYGEKLLKLDKKEIIALNTWQIQKLKQQVKKQDDIIKNLEERLKKLEESDK